MPDPNRYVWVVMDQRNPTAHAHVPSTEAMSVCREKRLSKRGYSLALWSNVSESSVKLCKKCWPR